MSDTTASLRRKIRSAGDLQSVVRTMKALAASSIGQYEKSVRALADYYRPWSWDWAHVFGRASQRIEGGKERTNRCGCDWRGRFRIRPGTGGQFNDVVADYAIKTLAALPGKPKVWAVGERVHARLADAGLPLIGLFTVPNSVQAITPLVGQIQIEAKRIGLKASMRAFMSSITVRSLGALRAGQPAVVAARCASGNKVLAKVPWPTKSLPEVLGGGSDARALIREYLFISLFRACAESLAAENASRLARWNVPTRTSKNCWSICTAHSTSLRQSGIDENCST